MKRFKVQQVYLAFIMLILSGFLITGCGSGGGEVTEHWAPADHTAPWVTRTVPADLAPSVAINTKIITAAFSEAMDPTTLTVASFTLWCDTAAGDTTQVQITGGGAVTYLAAGNIATLPLPAGTNLPADVTCTGTITTAATDLAGNQLAGNQAALPAASNFVWSFHTSTNTDFTNPTVLSTNPDADADVCLIKTISAAFDKAMDPTTIVSATPGALLTFTVYDDTAAANVLGTVAYDVTDMIATFTPSSDLIDGHGYTATITTDATDIASNPLAADKVWSFTADATLTCQASIDLGAAGTYGLMSHAAAVTIQANGVVIGNVALDPANACDGCTVGTSVFGVISNGDVPAHDAYLAAKSAYDTHYALATGACALPSPSDISAAQGACGLGYSPGTPGPVYGPGLYRTADPIGFTGTITLDANDDPNAVFIFQTDSALTTATSSVVVLAGGAKANNVFWIVGSAATLGVSSTFKGTVLANGAAVKVLGGTLSQPTLVEGRLFSSSAAAEVDTYATVTVPAD